jgi:hypothetical protein
MAALSEPSTPETVAVIASKFASALQVYDSGLIRLTIPTTMRADMQALLTADAALEKDLSSVAAVPGFTLAAWSQEITPDANRVVAASNAVRADLHLQPL